MLLWADFPYWRMPYCGGHLYRKNGMFPQMWQYHRLASPTWPLPKSEPINLGPGHNRAGGGKSGCSAAAVVTFPGHILTGQANRCNN